MNELILILNLLGTLFLSIEAIKIDNFCKITKFIRGSNNVLNPKIEWSDKVDPEPIGWSFKIDFFVFILLFSVPAYLFFSYCFEALKWYYKILAAFFGGFILWTILILVNELLIRLLKYIVRNTAKGIIGILGFILLAICFYLQYLVASQSGLSK